jgi:hypothetical protein
MRRNHTDRATFEILQKLAFHNQNNVKQNLHKIIVGFAVGEVFADVVDRSLHLVDVSGFLPLHHQGHPNNLGGCRDVEEEGFTQLWLG